MVYTIHISILLSNNVDALVFTCNLGEMIANHIWRKFKNSLLNSTSNYVENNPNKSAIIQKDKELNVKIDEILKRHETLKNEKKKESAAFTCPYCGKEYKGENLRHLLGCAERHPGDEAKLKAFFSGKWE